MQSSPTPDRVDITKPMSLAQAITHLSKKLSMQTIARLLGVSVNQVYKYKSGYTTSCSSTVEDKLYKNFRIVLDIYADEVDYIRHVKMQEEHGGARVKPGPKTELIDLSADAFFDLEEAENDTETASD